MNGKPDRSKTRMMELMASSNGLDVMRLVGRVLKGNYCMDEEEEEEKDVKKFENGANKKVADTNTCPGAIQGSTSGNGIDNKGTAIDKNPGEVNLGCGGEGSGLNGKVELVTNEPVPDGKLEIEEVNNGKADVSMLDEHGEKYITEKEGGEYHVSDLVWGKVRSHPWWPGQIFDPSAASNKARKYFKRDNYLVAYFGDQSFAWNDGSRIKPFRMHFSEMEKQSNAEGFSHAVVCALDEVSRRVEFGLSCPCLPQEVHNKIKSQVMTNAGIREESSRRDGGDNISNAASFSPGGLVQFLESLAEAPHSNTDRLQFSISKAQLLAFSRWRGHYQLPVLELCGGLLEDDTRFTVEGEEADSGKAIEELLPCPGGGSEVPSRKRKSTARGRKRKYPSPDEGLPGIKEKRMSVLVGSSNSSLPSNKGEAAKRTSRKAFSSAKKPESISSMPSNSGVKRRKSSLSSKSGNYMAAQTKASGRRSSHEVTRRTDGTAASYSAGKSQGVEIIPLEMPTPDEILSKLSFAARNPLRSFESINPVVGLLRGFGNSICLERSIEPSQKGLAAMQKGKQISNVGTTFGFAIEESCWRDRIIQSYSEDQVLFEPETSEEKPDGSETGIGKEIDAVVIDLETESLPGPSNEISEEDSPTALILNFSSLESIPSVNNLNEIFSSYGPLKESETEILSGSKRAKVIFKRRADAEIAFSSTGKYSTFGPSLISYRLSYAPTPRKVRATSKRSKKANP